VRVKSQPLNSVERRALVGLASIFGLRMLGLFLILPVFALYAEGLRGYTAFLAGLALGIYGLTQAIFQIPFGLLSDKIGRKPVIVAGLILFGIGSVMAAMADSMVGVIIGRALQGAGAIAAAVLALVADLTRDEQRTKAMFIIGVTIGVSFIMAILLGPVLERFVGVRGIFWLTAVLAATGVGVLLVLVPTPVRSIPHLDTQSMPAQFAQVLGNSHLLRFDIGVFVLHCVLTALFVAVPFTLVEKVGLPFYQHWQMYLPIVLLSAAIVLPAILLAERNRRIRHLLAGAVLILAVSQLALFQGQLSFLEVALALFLFFAAFNVLEAMLPSLISKAAPINYKGTAIGVYSTFQFMGAFVGGALGGWLYGQFDAVGVFVFTFAMLMFWFLIALKMQEPEHVTTRLVPVGWQQPAKAQELAHELGNIDGVTEAVVMAEEGVAYLKIDVTILDEEALNRFSYPPDPV
jgi:MFS family permease